MQGAPVGQKQNGQPPPVVKQGKPPVDDAKRAQGVTKVPTQQVPKGKKALAMILGLDLSTATPLQLTLFNRIHRALKEGGDFRYPDPEKGQLLIKNGNINLDEPFIGMSDFQILVSIFKGEAAAKKIEEYNATMTIGNQERSGEPNCASLRTIILLYMQCELKAGLKGSSPRVKDALVLQEMKRLLESKNIKFTVTGGNGQVSKSFLDNYNLSNPQMNQIIATVMELYGINSVGELKENVDALKALDVFIAEILLDKARRLDIQNGTYPENEAKVRNLIKNENNDKALAIRLGTSAAHIIRTGDQLEVGWIKSPTSAEDVIEQSAERFERLFKQMDNKTRKDVAERLGIEGEITSDKLITKFNELIWKELSDGERKEIIAQLKTNPEARKVFARLMEQYFTKTPITDKARGKELKRLQEQHMELKAELAGVDSDKTLKTQTAKDEKREKIRQKMAANKRRQKILQKKLAQAFYDEFLGRNKPKVPKGVQGKTLQDLRSGMFQDGLRALSRGGRFGAGR